MKKHSKIFILITLIFFLTSGCTTYLKDDDNKRVINEATGQSLPSNILCKPTNEKLLEIYDKHESKLEFKIDKLPRCEDLKLYDSSNYTGLWAQFFVIPLAWYIMKVGALFSNYGIAIMIVGVLIRVILLPISIKTTKQSVSLKNAQPALKKLEEKYKNKNDTESTMMKSQEMMAIYKKYNINPFSSCLTSFIQIPLFLAFLEAINRIPVIFEETLWTFDLGTTPLIGIRSGNYLYLILIILIIATTYLSFKINMNSMGSPEQESQMKFMTNFMLVFISIASFSLPTAIALYWVVTSAFAVVSSYIIKKRSR